MSERVSVSNVHPGRWGKEGRWQCAYHEVIPLPTTDLLHRCLWRLLGLVTVVPTARWLLLGLSLIVSLLLSHHHISHWMLQGTSAFLHSAGFGRVPLLKFLASGSAGSVQPVNATQGVGQSGVLFGRLDGYREPQHNTPRSIVLEVLQKDQLWSQEIT